MMQMLRMSCTAAAFFVPLITLLFVANPVNAASFDCAKASTTTEKIICSDAALSALDSSMAAAYRDALAQAPAGARTRLTGEQRAWLAETRDRCGDVACLAQAYAARQGQLQVQTLQWANKNAVSQVALGEHHSCSLSSAGAVSCRGRNDAGQVGNGKSGSNVTRTVQVIASGVTAVSAGSQHSCALLKDVLKCWGNNYSGQVGNGKTGDNVLRPTQVVARGVTHASTGGSHSCAVVKGALQCWGSNKNSKIGHPLSGEQVPSPVEVFAQGVTGVSAGEEHTCAIVSGALYCWGGNYNGQVGIDTARNDVRRPTKIIDAGVTAVSAGFRHTCAIADSALYCWGDNGSGEIGNGARGADVLRPARIIDSGVTAVSAGEDHTCAIIGGALHCWGRNFYGEIGNGGPGRDVLIPTRVIESGVTAVSAWGKHTCAVVNAAEVCWRYSAYGEIDPKPPGPKTVTSQPQAPNKAAGLDKYIGTFKGALISSGTEFVVTRFFYDSRAELAGEYTMIPYSGSKKGEEKGTLGPCKRLPDSEFLCRWQDNYGYGFLALQFDANATEFRGTWRNGDVFPQMKREYWLEQTGWNGLRQ